MELKSPERLQKFKVVTAPASFLENPEFLNSICFIAESVNGGLLEERPPPRRLLTDNQYKALLDEDRRQARLAQRNLQTLAEGILGRCFDRSNTSHQDQCVRGSKGQGTLFNRSWTHRF